MKETVVSFSLAGLKTTGSYSREGLFPRVRGKIGKRSNLYLSCSNILESIEKNPFRLKLSAIFELLDRELTEVYGSRTKWHHIIHPQGGAEH